METSFHHTKENNIDRLTITGPINEEAEVSLVAITSQLGNEVIVNFKEVTSVNSLGVRAWIQFMRELEGKKILFEHCPVDIVSQINMIPSFKGNAEIKSVYGSFYCDQCNQSTSVLFIDKENIDFKNITDFPTVNCESCGAEDIEFEELEDTYFSFAHH